MQTFLTADLHMNHTAILQYCERPFKTIHDHDSHLIYQINRLVKPQDALWIVGDFTFNRFKFFREMIKCENIYLCRGNHDKRLLPEDYDLFTKVYAHGLAVQAKINDVEFIFNHYCMLTWNKAHYGCLHCYGHSHANAEDKLDSVFPTRNSMDVGVDNCYRLFKEYRPFSIEEVIELIGSRKGLNVDHHQSKEIA